jgi:endogenous inhibitor of DNA gyrase (YacG/DUF329 family)
MPRKAKTIHRLSCDNCGIEVLRAQGHVNERNFCSRTCYWKSDYRSELVARRNYQINPDARVTEPCATCGKDVTRYVSTAPKVFYCNRACRWEKHQHAKQRNAAGYVLVFLGRGKPGADSSGHILEHRLVMQLELGRPLLPVENVHHLNGQKDDNRIENLELWSRSQPAGQRVADKLRWAHEFIAQYENKGEIHVSST